MTKKTQHTLVSVTKKRDQFLSSIEDRVSAYAKRVRSLIAAAEKRRVQELQKELSS